MQEKLISLDGITFCVIILKLSSIIYLNDPLNFYKLRKKGLLNEEAFKNSK